MAMLSKEHPIQQVCEALGTPRSTYYHRAKPADDSVLKAAIERVAGEWPTYGYRRITAQLRREPHRLVVNHKRVRRVMRTMGWLRKVRVKTRRTTDSAHDFPRYPNLVLGLEVERPDAVWVGDITYVRLPSEFVFLAVLMDLFTRCVRGWHLGRSLDGELTLTAWQRATRDGRAPEMHHSDQGVQYAATAYVQALEAAGVQISMATVGEPHENGYAERLIRTIKEEEVELSEYADYHDACRQMGRFLDEVYTHKRIHSSLGYLTPAEFESQWLQEQNDQSVVP